jgi:hypothetical protein
MISRNYSLTFPPYGLSLFYSSAKLFVHVSFLLYLLLHFRNLNPDHISRKQTHVFLLWAHPYCTIFHSCPGASTLAHSFIFQCSIHRRIEWLPLVLQILQSIHTNEHSYPPSCLVLMYVLYRKLSCVSMNRLRNTMIPSRNRHGSSSEFADVKQDHHFHHVHAHVNNEISYLNPSMKVVLSRVGWYAWRK